MDACWFWWNSSLLSSDRICARCVLNACWFWWDSSFKEHKMIEDYRNCRVPFPFMNTPTFYVMARRVLKFAKEANQNKHDSYQQQGKNSSGHRGGGATTKITASLRPTGEKSCDGSSHHIPCKDCGNDFSFPSGSNCAKHFAKMGYPHPLDARF